MKVSAVWVMPSRFAWICPAAAFEHGFHAAHLLVDGFEDAALEHLVVEHLQLVVIGVRSRREVAVLEGRSGVILPLALRSSRTKG